MSELIFVLCAVWFTWLLTDAAWHDAVRMDASEVKQLLSECESDLPRNESCELIAVLKVEEEK